MRLVLPRLQHFRQVAANLRRHQLRTIAVVLAVVDTKERPGTHQTTAFESLRIEFEFPSVDLRIDGASERGNLIRFFADNNKKLFAGPRWLWEIDAVVLQLFYVGGMRYISELRQGDGPFGWKAYALHWKWPQVRTLLFISHHSLLNISGLKIPTSLFPPVW